MRILNLKLITGQNIKIQKHFFYSPNYSEDVFLILKIKYTIPWTYLIYLCRNNRNKKNVISDLRGDEIVGTFYEKELQKTNQKENLIKRKRDKLHVKWKGYENLLNSWVDKKGTV